MRAPSSLAAGGAAESAGNGWQANPDHTPLAASRKLAFHLSTIEPIAAASPALCAPVAALIDLAAQVAL